MEDNPTRRLLVSGQSSSEHQPPMVPPCIPSIVDLTSHRRHLASSVIMPPFHPMPVCFNSSRGPGFFHYHVPPAPTPMAGGNGDMSHHMCSLSNIPSFSIDLAALPVYTHLDGSMVIPFTPSLVGFNQGLPTLPPIWAEHRRSQSDIALGFSQQNLQMTPLVPVKPEPIETDKHQSRGTTFAAPDNLVDSNMSSNMLGSSSNVKQELIDQLGSQELNPKKHRRIESTGNTTPNEANGMGGSSSMPRHCRSLSVDSSFMKRKLELGGGSSLHVGSGSNTGGGTTLIGNVEFSEAERMKIMESASLSVLVLSDPKKVKRILGNRVSAARSKERKMKYKVGLERKFQELQMQATSLSEQLAVAQGEFNRLVAENNELKIRAQELKRQKQMKQAIFEAKAAEAMQTIGCGGINYRRLQDVINQHMGTQMIQRQQPRTQAQPSETQQNQPQQIKQEPLG